MVYDQQVIEDEEMEALARQYDISYGKAYFLKELIDQNESLNIDDMEELASLSMEEIARKIAESSYELGELADQVKETELAPQTTAIVETETSTEVISTDESSTEIETTETSTTEVETTTIPETTKEPITEPETEEEELVEIDYVD